MTTLEEAGVAAWQEFQARQAADEPEQSETFVDEPLPAIEDWSTPEQVDIADEQPVVAPSELAYNAEDAIAGLNVAYVDAVLAYAAGVVNENLELRRITAAALLQARISAGLPPVAETPRRRRWWHRR